MASSSVQLLSPCSTERGRHESMSPRDHATRPGDRMLKINYLLNPSGSESGGRNNARSASPPATPAYSAQDSSTPSSPRPDTPLQGSTGERQKMIKDGAVFIRRLPEIAVNYPTFECSDNALCLSARGQEELAHQHRRFDIFPSGSEEHGLIKEYTRHIPYSSEKKRFFGRTGREAFEVFQYTFKVPGDSSNRKHVVMWDYNNGLVRITPFFKALGFSKTTPAKALTTNPGLKDLSHSITGGALAAQGYWMPYACARAICLTFCHEIRWALTPIFGTSFLRESLRPEDPGYRKFLIEPEVVRCARLEADGMRADASTSSRDGSPALPTPHHHHRPGNEIPRSVPAPQAEGIETRSRDTRSTFRHGSPFSPPERHYSFTTTTTSPSHAHAPAHTSTNSPTHTRALSPSPPPLSPRSSQPPSPTWTPVNTSSPRLLLTEPRSAAHPGISRPASASASAPQTRSAAARADTPTPASSRIETRGTATTATATVTAKRRRRSSPASPPPSPPPTNAHARDRSRRTSSCPDSDSDGASAEPNPERKRRALYNGRAGSVGGGGVSRKFDATDMRAARWLLNLHVRGAGLGVGGSGRGRV